MAPGRSERPRPTASRRWVRRRSLVATRRARSPARRRAIARITDEVSEGADAQVRSLDGALSGLNEMTASLKETAGQAESVAASAEELAVVGSTRWRRRSSR